MDDDEIRRLAERIRQAGAAGPQQGAADDAIPMLTEVVDEGLPSPGRPASELEALVPGEELGPASGEALSAPIDPAVLSDDALLVALEVRIADQVLGRLTQHPERLDGAVEDALQAALARLADTLAGELHRAFTQALRDRLEPTVREAVRDAVQEAVRGSIDEVERPL